MFAIIINEDHLDAGASICQCEPGEDLRLCGWERVWAYAETRPEAERVRLEALAHVQPWLEPAVADANGVE
jgi:hypothetical protein